MPEKMGMKPMELKINVDEKSGKITQMTFLNDGINMEAFQRAMSSILQNGSAADTKQSVMAKDITDLSADKPTLKERLTLFLRFEFPENWFTTQDVKAKYDKMYAEEIKLSTVSTYLTRLFNEGFLERRGNRIEREYHVITVDVEEKVVERAVQRSNPLAEPKI
jgi:hypothetical protein